MEIVEIYHKSSNVSDIFNSFISLITSLFPKFFPFPSFPSVRLSVYLCICLYHFSQISHLFVRGCYQRYGLENAEKSSKDILFISSLEFPSSNESLIPFARRILFSFFFLDTYSNAKIYRLKFRQCSSSITLCKST